MSHIAELEFETPPERPRLEPFATIFLDVMVPEAVNGNWFEDRTTPPQEDLARISRRIEEHLEPHFGHKVHPAIWIHALLVCCHYFYVLADAREDPGEADRHTSALDAAFSLTQNLKLHHDLYDLYLRTS